MHQSNILQITRLTLISFIYLLFKFPLQAQELKLYEAPENYQLYCRDENNTATVMLSGRISGIGFQQLDLITYIDNELLEAKTEEVKINEQGFGNFFISQKIKSGLFQYKFELKLTNEQEKRVLYTADSVVCGDAFIITGQSNSHASSSASNFSSPYCRSFGVKTGLNPYTDDHKKYRWGRATGNCPRLQGIGGWYTDNPFGIGVWGMYLAQKITETHRIPVCIINGGSGNSTIEQNLPANFQADLNTSFGRLIYRVHEAGLTCGIKALLWHQGESNTNQDYEKYEDDFDTLYFAWKANFPSLHKVYMFQLHPGCGGDFQSEFRDLQVKIADRYTDVDIMSTVGLPEHDGCHYTDKGYIAMAELIYPLLSEDFYGFKSTSSITPPKIRSAYWSRADYSELCLQFDQDIVWNAQQTINNFTYYLKDYIYLDGNSGLINEGFADGNKLFLKLKKAEKYNWITYLSGHFYEETDVCYEGPWIMGVNGIGALSFNKVKIK